MPEDLFIVLGPLLFIASFPVSIFLVAIFSRWKTIAKRFQATRPFAGQLLKFRWARIGLVNFTGVIHIGFDKSGLYLQTIFPVGLMLKPLLIPWSEIEVTKDSGVVIRLSIESCGGAHITVHGEIFSQFARYLQHPPGT